MPWMKFNDAYDHVWPSRAQTHFPAGYVGNVKKEVADAATAKGKAEPTTRPEAEAAEPVDSEAKSG